MKTSRRHIIKQSSLGALGIYLNQNQIWATTEKWAAKDRLCVALVGYYTSEILAHALQQTKNCYSAGIVTGTPPKATLWQQQYKITEQNCYTYETFDLITKNSRYRCRLYSHAQSHA